MQAGRQGSRVQYVAVGRNGVTMMLKSAATSRLSTLMVAADDAYTVPVHSPSPIKLPSVEWAITCQPIGLITDKLGLVGVTVRTNK